MSEARDLIHSLSFCVFDLETTGGNHKSDKIIEIGLVKIENMEIVKKKNYLIQPEIKIPEFIQKLTTITPQDVKLAPIIEDVIEEILEFMGDSILVAHNTSFDVPFFNSVLKRLGIPELKNNAICTNLMTKYLIPNLMNTNLNYMSKIFDISHSKAHRALDDALATAELLIRYLKIFIAKDIPKVNHLYYPRNRYELDRINYKPGVSPDQIRDKLASLKSSSLVTLKGDNGVILFAVPLVPGKLGKKTIELIVEQLGSLSWEILTIRITGPFIEALIHYSALFNKLDSQLKFDVIDHLWSVHLGGERHETTEPLTEFGDFIICHHLVPEQLILYPAIGLEPKSGLVFRYPGHQKKMLQFINSKTSRIENSRFKHAHHHALLKDFIYEFFKRENQNRTLFFFTMKEPQKHADEFIGQLEEFLADNPNPYHYPSDYV
jgi:DNA polymerase III subunit epsilon